MGMTNVDWESAGMGDGNGDGEKVKNRGMGKIFKNFSPKMLENTQRSRCFAKIDLIGC